MKTTYSFLFRTQSLPILLITPIILALIYDFNDTSGNYSYIMGMTLVVVFSVIFGHIMFQKHKEVSDKFNTLLCN